MASIIALDFVEIDHLAHQLFLRLLIDGQMDCRLGAFPEAAVGQYILV